MESRHGFGNEFGPNVHSAYADALAAQGFVDAEVGFAIGDQVDAPSERIVLGAPLVALTDVPGVHPSRRPERHLTVVTNEALEDQSTSQEQDPTIQEPKPQNQPTIRPVEIHSTPTIVEAASKIPITNNNAVFERFREGLGLQLDAVTEQIKTAFLASRKKRDGFADEETNAFYTRAARDMQTFEAAAHTVEEEARGIAAVIATKPTVTQPAVRQLLRASELQQGLAEQGEGLEHPYVTTSVHEEVEGLQAQAHQGVGGAHSYLRNVQAATTGIVIEGPWSDESPADTPDTTNLLHAPDTSAVVASVAESVPIEINEGSVFMRFQAGLASLAIGSADQQLLHVGNAVAQEAAKVAAQLTEDPSLAEGAVHNLLLASALDQYAVEGGPVVSTALLKNRAYKQLLAAQARQAAETTAPDTPTTVAETVQLKALSVDEQQIATEGLSRFLKPSYWRNRGKQPTAAKAA